MSCNSSKLDIAYLKSVYEKLGFKNYSVRTIRFLSTTQNVDNLTSAFVPDVWDGYIKDQSTLIELEKLSDSIQISTGSENINLLPYADKFRPIDRIDDLRTKQHVIVTNIEFTAFDTSKDSSTNQDSTANTYIQNNQANIMGASGISRVFGAIPPTWLNTFFRPLVMINENNIMDFQQTQFGTNYNHKADKSIGLQLPYSEELYLYFENGIRDLSVRGICGQLVTNGTNTYLKRYPVLTTIRLTHV